MLELLEGQTVKGKIPAGLQTVWKPPIRPEKCRRGYGLGSIEMM